MSNFLGTGDPKVIFTWDSVAKTVEFDSKRIQFMPNFNIEEKRIHPSALNGTVTKEHLGYYHEAELYLIDITEDEFEDTLQYLQVVDSVTLTPFKDNLDFTIEMVIDKANPYEFEHIGESIAAFYLKMSSNSYDEIIPKPTFIASRTWLSVEEITI